MEKEKVVYGAHVLALPYPSQGHINPMLQFCKRLVSKRNIKATLAITNFISNSIHPQSSSVQLDTISDGYDEAELIKKHQSSEHPITCVLYDAVLPWALDVTKQFGLIGASFFTQPCAVNYIYYYAHHGLLKLPVSELPISIPGLPLLELQDMPSFIMFTGRIRLILSWF
ncbi:unnamed protein product [Ilex paraguariensis]|uniref:Uncharacterized protein n=1 Tax=Ilex paraguariensis TaxID=185542 RepID=A0ABC8UQG6_9AQUA